MRGRGGGGGGGGGGGHCHAKEGHFSGLAFFSAAFL